MTTQRRAVYPSAATSLSLARCSVEAQLLFTRLIAAADDQGRLQGDPMLVKSQCCPLIARANAKTVDRWLGELATNEMILRYEAHGQSLIQVTNWWPYQGWLRHLRASRWPAPPGVEDREKGHGLADERPPDSGQDADKRPQGGGPDVSGDSDVDVDVSLDKSPDVDVERPTPPPPTDLYLNKVTTTHFDLTGRKASPGGIQMYRDLLRDFGFDVVNRAQWNEGATDKTDRGFIGRVKTRCKRLAA